jgi:outer membrane biosynthesis protein TonB
MIPPTPRRDIVIALLVAAWAHVGLFFAIVLLLVFDLLAARVIEEDQSKEEEIRPIKMQVVYADPVVAPVDEAALPEPVEPVTAPEPVMPEEEAFVQTSESQIAEEAPKETPFIGERNTTATSDAGAVAGHEKMSALAGEEERKSDPKTFDSDFSDGETSGPIEGMKETVEAGEGDEKVNEEAIAATEAKPEPLKEALPGMEEEVPKSKENDLAAIDKALAALEEAMGEEMKEPVGKVEETLPEKPAEKEQEASNQDGGFAPRTRKTRVAGVLSASGKGSLNVTNTPAGRYQADILKKLETAWQIDNYRHRSLNNPGQVSLYFVVDRKGKVSRQRQLSRVGASDNQLGRILGAVESIKIPKMPKDVIKDLDGDALELMVTFNY